MPVVVKTRLPGFALTLAISSRTGGGSGTTCARPFFVLLPGMFQVAPSSLSSPRVMPATSFRLWPVSSNTLSSGANGRGAPGASGVDGFACPPKPADFVGGQHAIARLRPRGPVDTGTRIALDAALTLEPAEHAREGGKERAPTAVGYVAIARRDAGYSDPPGLIDHAPDVVGVDAGDRPVCPALREAALGLFGFPITMVAQAQKPSGLKPVPRLRPGVLGDVGAHAGAERISGSLLDLGALAMPTRSMVATTSWPSARSRCTVAASWRAAWSVSGCPICGSPVSSRPDRSNGPKVILPAAIRSAKPHLPRLVTAWLDDEEEAARCGVADPAALRAGHASLRHAASVRILATA